MHMLTVTLKMITPLFFKELQTVERGFRCLKDVLAIRPIYHWTEPRVRPHLFVAHLALVLGVALEVALRRAGLALSLDTALEALRPARLVTLELDGHQTRLITQAHPSCPGRPQDSGTLPAHAP